MPVATQTIIDQDRNLVMKFTNIDETEAAVRKVDVSTLQANGNGDPCTGVVIRRLIGVTEGMSVDILWDATVNVLALTTPTDDYFDLDFSEFQGIPNDAGSGITGDILFTTNGATAGDRYTIILQMIKKYD